MKLNEFVDKNGNKINLSTPAGSQTTSSGSFKKRLEKLLAYATRHRNYQINKVLPDKLTDDTLEFTEFYVDDSTRTFKIFIGPTTEAWRVRIYHEDLSTPDEDFVGTGWMDLLVDLSHYIKVPVTGTPEYSDLLTEWVDKTGNKINLNNSSSQAANNTSTKTNKEKFTHLLYYMKKNKASNVTKAEVVRLDDGGFTYKEYLRYPSGQDLIFTLLVGYSRFNSSWRLELYVDTNIVKEVQGSGWEELLKELDPYFHVPKAGTSDYDLLCESYSIADDFKTYENLWD